MKRYALFIGINEYEDRAIKDLSCACNDAEKLAEAFCDYDDVQVMLNSDVNQTEVIATVDKLIKDSKPDDVFLFYFSGHSCEISGEHHLLCSDARQSLLQFNIGSIPLNAIKSLTDKPGLQRLFILDSCRTELYTNTRNTTGCPKSRGVSFGSVLKQHANAQIIPPVILTSCSSGEYAYEDDASGHGYFTLALLHTLKSPLSSIDDFRTKLDLNINSFRLPGMQTVCWNGSLSHNLPFVNWQSETSAGADSLMLRELERIRRERAELEAAEQLRIERAKLEKLKAEIQAREEAERRDILENFVANAERQGFILSEDKQTIFGVMYGTIQSVNIPYGITTIGDSAFWGCESLTNVTIPDSVTSIGNSAFWGCESLTNVTIPDSVTSIGDDMFWKCKKLTSVTIPDSVTSIGDFAFYKCSSLTSVTIPDGVTNIGNGAFAWCSNLTSVTIPDSVTSIGEWAFSRCSNLTSVTIPINCELGYSTFPDDCEVIRRN